MLRAALKDLLFHRSVWIGLAVAALISAAAVSLSLYLGDSLNATPGAESLTSFVGLPLVMSMIAVALVVRSIAGLSAKALQKNLALWRIIGLAVSPLRILLLAQIIIVTVLFAAIGSVVGVALCPPYVRVVWLQSGASGEPVVVAQLGSAVLAVVLVTCAAIIGAASAVVRSTQGSLVARLRDLDEPSPSRGTLIRWLLLGAGAIVVSLIVNGMMSVQSLSILPILGMFVGFPLIIAFAVTASTVFPQLIRLITAAVPIRESAVWLLARRSAISRTTTDTSAVLSVFVAAAIVGTLFGGLLSYDAALTHATKIESGGINNLSILSVVGPPLIVAVAGSSVAIFMSDVDRHKDVVSARLIGTSRAQLLAVSFWEALIYVVVAIGTGVTVSLIVGLATALAAQRQGVQIPLQIGWAQLALVAGISMVVVFASTAIPTAVSARGKSLITMNREG
ncbi:FtsX-like permease family protein [Microbacterium sp. NPDC057650]|uniref:FtsX-like permease family protein n=1 Tax=unclassified Microbacterium TaxID=2609290 RepID=UPI00366FEEB0